MGVIDFVSEIFHDEIRIFGRHLELFVFCGRLVNISFLVIFSALRMFSFLQFPCFGNVKRPADSFKVDPNHVMFPKRIPCE